VSAPILATKLLFPLPRSNLVPRPRLVERLMTGWRDACKLILVSAPAGYGKTTLITDWLAGLAPSPAPQVRNAEVRVSWLSLDESDNDPARFVSYLLAALQQIDPAIGQAAQALLQIPGPPQTTAALTSLANDLAAQPAPFLLVLDDYHLIQAPPVHQIVAFFLEHGPPQMRLVVATREDPPLPLARLRARGQILDIRQSDLKFTEAETAAFLRQAMRLDLAAADVTTLHQRTEGWIAGLQLAALSMQQSADAGRFVARLSGSDRYILDYLVEEVFQRQTPEVQAFLLRTSILDRLCAGLCDALLGRGAEEQRDGGDSSSPPPPLCTSARELLDRLDRANLFVVPLDQTRQWYRYHHLFRDLLRARRGALDVAELHRRAAAWFEQHDFLDEALEHCLAAADWDAAERLLSEAAAGAINRGQFATLSRWLDALPKARLRRNPEMAALKGWALLALGQFDAVTSWASLAESLLGPDAPPFSRALVLCLQTYVAQLRADIPQVIALAERALTLLATGDPHGLRGAALANLASAQISSGDIPAAAATLAELARVGQARGHAISAVSALCNLAELEHRQGRAREALALGRQALDLAVDGRGHPLPLAGHAHLALGLVYFDLDDLARAREHLAQGIALGQQLGPTSGALQAAFTLARIQQRAGETEAALATAAAARRSAAALNLPLAEALAAAYEADFRLALGDVAAAMRWAAAAGLAPTDTPTFVREAEYVIYARVLLAQDRAAEARTLLANFERYARQAGLAGTLITVCVLQAQSAQALGQRAPALAPLAEAVRLAAPEGCRRAFLDGGPAIAALLPGVRHVAPAFVDALLGRLRPAAEQGKPAIAQPLIEPLSERELEVLRLIADGLSNAEIAAKLFVTVGTAKTHVHNILGKLGADGRPRAIARARELGLIG